MLTNIRPYRHTTTCSRCGNTWSTVYDWKHHRCTLPVYGPANIKFISDFWVDVSFAVDQWAKTAAPVLEEISKNMQEAMNGIGKALMANQAVFEGGRYYGSQAGKGDPECWRRSDERGDKRRESAAVAERQSDGHRRKRRRKGH